MKVWVVEKLTDRYAELMGVFDSQEKAEAAVKDAPDVMWVCPIELNVVAPYETLTNPEAYII